VRAVREIVRFSTHVLTTNRIIRDWGTLFDVDNTLATALIDRLMHHGEALVIKGDSYRMKATSVAS
jgi:DNA replication protein DnaC